jgi:hypothetical protein
LLAITPGDGRDLKPWLHALAGAGLRHVLIREPGMGDAVDALVGIVENTWVHERTAAPRRGRSCHLRGGSDPRRAPARAGVSCHSEGEVDQALERGAAYCLLSPIWSPTSKPADARPVLGLEPLRRFRGRPVLALGGVTAERFVAHELSAAVCGDLFALDTPAAAARRLGDYQL